MCAYQDSNGVWRDDDDVPEYGDDVPEYGVFEVPATPKDGVVGTTPGERALGKFFHLDLPIKPTSEAQSDLAGDAFFAHYKRNPTMIEDVSPSRSVNKKLLEWAKSVPTWDTKDTNGNIVSSLAAAGLLWGHLTSEDALKDINEKQKEAEEKEKEAEQHLENMAEASEQGDEETAEAEQQAADQAQAEAQAIAQAASEAIDKLQNNPLAKGMMQSSVEEAEDKAKEVAQVMSSWGIGAGNVNMDDAAEIMEMTDSDLQEIADMIGRMQDLSTKTIEKTKNSYTGLVSEAAMTRDVTKIFVSQRAKLSPNAAPYIRAQAIQAVTTGGGLMGWRPKFEGKKAGAFFWMTDRSGSMYGDPLNAAKAVPLGMAKSLVADKDVSTRYYEGWYFDDGIPDVHVTSENDWHAHIEWAKLECSGGTNINKAILFAIDRLRAIKAKGIDGADFMLLTDEQAPLSDEVIAAWKKLKGELDTRLFVISISSWGSGGNQKLEELADVIIKVGRARNLPRMAADIVQKLTAQIVKADMSR